MSEKERGDAEPNELTTVASYYYLLYRGAQTAPSGASHEANSFWQEDEWSEQETLEAEHILREAEERCAIVGPSSAIIRCPLVKDWDSFYQHNTTNFFNDRHWLTREFPDEFCSPETCVEIGCGVGNNMFPLLETGWTVWGLDFSSVAIKLLKQDERFQSSKNLGKAHAQVLDISQQITDPLPWLGTAHVATLLFCLSALDPNQMSVAARNAAAMLRPGGILLFRDYGRYDEAQLKLGTSRSKKLGEHWYRKHDGTRVYYFSVEDLERLFVDGGGLEAIECKYIRRAYHNRATRERRRRVWVQGRFRLACK